MSTSVTVQQTSEPKGEQVTTRSIGNAVTWGGSHRVEGATVPSSFRMCKPDGISLVNGPRFAKEPSAISLEMLVRLRELAAQEGTDLWAALAAALQALGFRYIGQSGEELAAPVFRTLLRLKTVAVQSCTAPTAGAGYQVGLAFGSDLPNDCDLTLHLAENEQQAAWSYRGDVFDSVIVQSIDCHLCQLLAGLIANPDESVDKLPLLSAEERRLILEEWNDTRTDYPRNQSVADLFAQVVSQYPLSVAVTSEDRQATYLELNRRANQLAFFLKRLGISEGQAVGISLPRSLDMIVSMLGILKTGASYVPLDVKYPGERIRFMIEDAKLSLVVTESALAAAFAETRVALVCLDSAAESIAKESSSNPPGISKAGDTAYIMYTSGSTGLPKGVEIPHRAIVRLVRNTNYVAFGPAEVFGQISNASFDAITFEVWGALLNGGKLVILPDEIILSPERFSSAMKEHGLTAMFLTTALFNLMASKAPQGFLGFRHLMVGGDAVDPRWSREVLRVARPGRLINGYGPTECTTFSVTHFIDDVPEQATVVPIGRPIANSTAYVLDRHLEPVPPGVTGELFLGGDGLAKGYVNRPELTAERFIPNPFGEGRLYRTGDVARYRRDGIIEVLGRTDHQVKIRGFRIELGEIEATLRQHGEVSDCAVVVKRDTNGGKQLVAYAAASCNGAELRSFLQSKLPSFMVPSVVMVLQQMPLTPNGKIDRNALPEAMLPSVTATTSTQPENATEKTVSAVWCKVLGLDSVAVDQNFFDLGGNSILLAMVETELREQGITLPITDLFRYPTVRTLAERLSEGTNEKTAVAAAQDRASKLHNSLSRMRRNATKERA